METNSVGPDKRVACDWANEGGGGRAGASCCAVNNGWELPGGRGWGWCLCSLEKLSQIQNCVMVNDSGCLKRFVPSLLENASGRDHVMVDVGPPREVFRA